MGFFERYLTVWVGLCIVAGIALGKVAPEVAQSLDAMAISVNGAPVVSIPIAICLFFMMYPIMVKIDFGEVLKAGRAVKPVGLTLFINWAVKPFTMYLIASFFLGSLFLGFIGPEATDLVKMPLGKDFVVGDSYGSGTVVLVEGVRCSRCPCGAATWPAASCWGSRPVPPWCLCGDIFPKVTTATRWSWSPSTR